MSKLLTKVLIKSSRSGPSLSPPVKSDIALILHDDHDDDGDGDDDDDDNDDGDDDEGDCYVEGDNGDYDDGQGSDGALL